MSSKADREFIRLRAGARIMLLKHGTALAPYAVAPDGVDDLIADLVARHRPALRRESEALYGRVPDRDLSIEIDNHSGAIMAAYGDAGYFVGICMGLELAALTLGGVMAARRPAPSARPRTRRRKGGAR